MTENIDEHTESNGGLFAAPAARFGEDAAAFARSREALGHLREQIERLTLPMETPGAATMRAERDRMTRLLDDFLGRHMKQRDAPLLVVIGGPTGAGKSTLLNSLVGAKVSASGVLRPTTAEPVLVYNPADGPSFFRRRLLPNLAPASAGGHGLINPEDEGGDEQHMRLVPSDEVAPGLAIIDSPDFDSYQVANHDLASDLLDIADLWLYVTTGTDYAKAVPWDFLRAAAARRLGIATVLNRMRPYELEVVDEDLRRLLVEQGLGEAPMFVIPEVKLQDGRIPVGVVEPLWRWLDEQAGSPSSRRGYVERAVEGTIDEVLGVTERLAEAAADQVVADRRLRVDLRAAFRRAKADMAEAVAEGGLDLSSIAVPEPEVPAEPRPRGARFRWLLGTAPGEQRAQKDTTDELLTAVGAFARRVNRSAVSRVAELWSVHPAAKQIGLERMLESVGAADREIDEAVGEWLQDVSAATFLPESGGPGRTPGPGASLAVAVAALSGPGDGVAVDVEPLRENLVRRLAGVLDGQEGRLAELLGEISSSSVTDLRDAGTRLREAWREENRD